MKSNTLGKLYLIPITLSNPGETTVVPEDVLPQTIKRAIDFIDYYIVENGEKGPTAVDVKVI